MTKKDKLWIWLMEWCCKYWGCHQMPERSFFIHGYQVPVCARCTGIIVGGVFSVLVSPFYDFDYIILALMVPMAVDGLLQLKTAYISTNPKRFISGLLYGFSFVSVIIHTLRIIL